MSKRIEHKCKCGSSIIIEDTRQTYINKKGKPDNKGRIYLIDKQSDDWLELHEMCLMVDDDETEE